MPLRRTSTPLVLAAFLAMPLLSCEDSFSPGVGPPAALRHAGGNAQRDTIGAVLAEPLAVRVVDAAGHPVGGVVVRWAPTAGFGEVDPLTSTSDADGIARSTWHLGRTAGAQYVAAEVDGVQPLLFLATALAVVRGGALDWALVHRGLPEPDGPVIGLSGSSNSDVFAAIETGRVFWYDGFGWSELISNPSPGPLSSMWGPASTAIFATGRTATGDTAFIASFVGQHWTRRHALPGHTLLDVHGLDANDLWAVGTRIAHYDGAGWTEIPAPGGTMLRVVWAVSPGVAFAGADDGAIHRVDTIATQTGNPRGVGIRALFGSAPDNVYAGDASGTILHWDGSQWAIAADFGPEPITAIWGTAPNDVWVSGGVYAHFDGGAWTVLDEDAAFSRGTVSLWGASAAGVWAVTDSMRLKLYDGTTWREHWDSPIPFEGIWGSSANDLHVCGGQGTIQRFDGNQWSTDRLSGWQACRSLDGLGTTLAFASTGGPNAYRFDGNGWERAPTGTALAGGIWVDPSGIAMVPGPAGTVMRFDGTSWAPLATGVGAAMHTVWGSSPTDVWAGGASGTMLHYDGATWTTVPSGTTGTIRRVWGAGRSAVWAVADAGASGSTILRYDGSQWRSVHASSARLLAVHGRDASDVFAAGESGTILRWDGQQWQPESTGITERLRDVWASPNGDVFAVGDRGLIHRGRR